MQAVWLHGSRAVRQPNRAALEQCHERQPQHHQPSPAQPASRSPPHPDALLPCHLHDLLKAL
jgi:hypothetical protein